MDRLKVTLEDRPELLRVREGGGYEISVTHHSLLSAALQLLPDFLVAVAVPEPTRTVRDRSLRTAAGGDHPDARPVGDRRPGHGRCSRRDFSAVRAAEATAAPRSQ